MRSPWGDTDMQLPVDLGFKSADHADCTDWEEVCSWARCKGKSFWGFLQWSRNSFLNHLEDAFLFHPGKGECKSVHYHRITRLITGARYSLPQLFTSMTLVLPTTMTAFDAALSCEHGRACQLSEHVDPVDEGGALFLTLLWCFDIQKYGVVRLEVRSS